MGLGFSWGVGPWLLGLHALGGITKRGSISDEQYVWSMAAREGEQPVPPPPQKGVGVRRVLPRVGAGTGQGPTGGGSRPPYFCLPTGA